MSALDFPAAPAIGDVFDRWAWNGEVWVTAESQPVPFFPLIATGSTNSGNIAGGGTSTTVNVVFPPGFFTRVPLVVANTHNAFNTVAWAVSIRSVSAAGCTLFAGGAGFPGAGVLRFDWVAVQAER